MNKEIEDKVRAYMNLNKNLTEIRKKSINDRKLLQKLESEILEYMKEHTMETIALDEGEIICYDKKINQTFKKEAMIENINSLVKNTEKSEKLVETILSNKSFKLEKKIKTKLKVK